MGCRCFSGSDERTMCRNLTGHSMESRKRIKYSGGINAETKKKRRKNCVHYAQGQPRIGAEKEQPEKRVIEILSGETSERKRT